MKKDRWKPLPEQFRAFGTGPNGEYRGMPFHHYDTVLKIALRLGRFCETTGIERFRDGRWERVFGPLTVTFDENNNPRWFP